MELQKSIKINKGAADVWNVLAENFDRAQDWMATVPVSYKKEEGTSPAEGPMIGRICEFTNKPNGPLADEIITIFDRDTRTLGIHVVPRNVKLPVEHNHATYSLNELSANETEVVMTSDVQLKTAGKLLYPALKAGLSKSFKEQLEELKYYVETGQPHPRKK
jgi:hypothetical protein